MRELREYGINPVVADPEADAAEAKRLYGIDFSKLDDVRGMDAVILAVAHAGFRAFTRTDMDRLFGPGRQVLLDIKGVFDRRTYEDAGYVYWRL